MLPLLLLLAPPEPAPADLPGFRTAKTALRADPRAFAPAPVTARPGFAGVEVAEADGKAVVGSVLADSPAAAAGLKPGDVVTAVGDVPTPTPAALRDRLRRLLAGELATFAVRRGDKALSLPVTPRPVSQPYSPADGTGRPILGVQTEEKPTGWEVTAVTAGGPADKAGLKVGDQVLKVDANELPAGDGLRGLLTQRRVGETLSLQVRRGMDELTLRATLAAEATTKGTGWDDRLPRGWARSLAYKLAILGIDYPDVKHEREGDGRFRLGRLSLFSRGKYTGQERRAGSRSVHGSMNDYYKEISYDAVQGRRQIYRAGWK